jgi:DNA-binding transcriptional LysR family regulator
MTSDKRIVIAVQCKIHNLIFMDIGLARTFLEIAQNGSFAAAAERLNLTQTAVSARIRALEQQIGRRLFVRNKAGARLTPAGERFVGPAAALVQVWERARQEVALPPGREEGISLGGELSLWHPLLADWLAWMHRECPRVALRVEVDTPSRLVERVREGSLDLVTLYNPPQYRDIVAELVVEEQLVLVTTATDGTVDRDSYILVDWGPAFALNHRAAFPDFAAAPLAISLGPLALTHILSVGGSGYFRAGAVTPFLADGRLRLVKGAPAFSHSIYALHAARRDNPALHRAREGLRFVAARAERPGLGVATIG